MLTTVNYSELPLTIVNSKGGVCNVDHMGLTALPPRSVTVNYSELTLATLNYTIQPFGVWVGGNCGSRRCWVKDCRRLWVERVMRITNVGYVTTKI